MDQFFEPVDDVAVEDFLGEAQTSPVREPDASVRNHSAAISLLAGKPDEVVGNYRALVAENEQGGKALRTSMEQSIKDAAGQNDLSVVMGILSDKNQSIENKRKAMEWMRKPSSMKDTYDMLLSTSVAKPNGNESVEQEDVRISIAQMMEENRKSRETIQGIVNAHGASLPSVNVKTGVDMTEAWVLPFTNSLSVMKTVTALREKQGRPVTLFDFVKAFSRPGAANMEIRDEIDALPPQAKERMVRDLVGVIKDTSNIIIPSDNHFVQFQRASELLGDYDEASANLDTISNLFDLVGLGVAWRSFKAKKALQATPGATPPPAAVPEAAGRAPEVPIDDIFSPARMPVPDQDIAGKQAAITRLEEERASALGGSSQLLEPGQVRQINDELKNLKRPVEDTKARAKEIQKETKVSYKQALSQAEKELSASMAEFDAQKLRLEQQIEANAAAAKNEQRLAELDKQIAALKKGVPEEPTPLLSKLADAINRIDLRSNVYTHNPAAPGNILSFGNPSQARALHASLITNQSDEVAQALFGTSRVDAIAANTVPQVTSATGTVLARTPDVERALRAGVDVDPELLTLLNKTGSLNFTQAEKAAARAAYINDFRQAANLTMNEAMSSFTVDGGRIRISAMYGGPEGGFANADDAVAQAISSLRKYDVSTDNLKLMGRDGVEFVELDSKNVPLDRGEYYVRVDTYQEISPTGFHMDTDWDTRWNFFDRVASLVGKDQGSLTRHLFTSGMVIDPKFTNAASRASDFASEFEKVMLNIANDFAETRNSLNKTEQKLLDNYIKEANFQELPLNVADLVTRGFTSEGIQAAQLWRKYWDNHFYLENYDMVRTMKAQGFEKFVGMNGTELYVKPVVKNQNLANVYDSTLGRVVVPTKADGDALYNAGGTYARLRRPTLVNGELVEHVIVRNNLSEYVRVITDRDQILNYKNGYFQIQYNAPRFIDEYTTVGGKEIRRAIAVAGDSYEAETFARRMRAQNTNNKYVVRGDDNAMSRSSDDWWDLQEASGRIAQKHRGQLLQDSTGINHLGDTNYIVDPVTSAIRAARSISGRTIGRPFLEASKMRIMAKYGHVFPSNPVTKEVMWPGKIGDIGARGGQFSDDVRDARTMFEYINYMENGYINGIDDFVKGTLNSVAAMLGKKAAKGSKAAAKAERASSSLAELSNPASLAKNGVFWFYIALNPLRQLIVQPHQALRMFAYDAASALEAWTVKTGQYVKVALNPTGQHSKDELDFFKFVENSGQLSAVDKHNLVRGALVDAAESSNVVTRNIAKGANVPRKLGFDAGERMNMLVHLATVYSSYKKAGKNVNDLAVAEKAYAEARALSYNMNFAGDMPYNQNTLGFLLQFMQIPHKALFQAFDRQLSVNTRLRLIGADVLMFGPPTVLLSELLGGDILPDNPELRTALTNGLEQWGLNKIWSMAAKEDVNIDYSSLDPRDISGWVKFFQAIFSEGGVEEVMMNSASGGLFLRDAGKVQNLIRSVGRLMNVVEDPLNETDLKQVMLEAARISSGFSNAEKAMLLLHTERRIAASGIQMDDKASYMDAMAQLFGFGSFEQKQMAELANSVYKAGQKRQDEWAKVYSEITRYYTDVLSTDNADPEWMTAVTGHILGMYKDDPVAQKYFTSRLAADIGGKDNKLIYQVMKLSGYEDAQEFKDRIRMSNLPEEQKKQVIEIIDTLHSMREE